MSKIVIALVRFYQYFVSPLFGPSCRFHPSCSHYAIEALQKFGLIKGSFLTLRRVLRCHPGNPGGYDPVPFVCTDADQGACNQESNDQENHDHSRKEAC